MDTLKQPGSSKDQLKSQQLSAKSIPKKLDSPGIKVNKVTKKTHKNLCTICHQSGHTKNDCFELSGFVSKCRLQNSNDIPQPESCITISTNRSTLKPINIQALNDELLEAPTERREFGNYLKTKQSDYNTNIKSVEQTETASSDFSSTNPDLNHKIDNPNEQINQLIASSEAVDEARMKALKELAATDNSVVVLRATEQYRATLKIVEPPKKNGTEIKKRQSRLSKFGLDNGVFDNSIIQTTRYRPKD